MDAGDAAALVRNHRSRALVRTATALRRADELPPEESLHLRRFHLAYEQAMVESFERFFPLPLESAAESRALASHLYRLMGGPLPGPAPGAGAGADVFARNGAVKGPMSVFGYDYLQDHLGRAAADSLRLRLHRGLRGSGGDYAYEVLNLVDGRRTVQEIRDAVSAIYGPVPVEFVVEYARALESIGVIRRRP